MPHWIRCFTGTDRKCKYFFNFSFTKIGYLQQNLYFFRLRVFLCHVDTVTYDCWNN